MSKIIKLVCILIAALLLGACEEYRGIPRVCVNYFKHDQYCGTGFFIAPDTLITADHIVDKARDGVLTIVGPGVNEKIKKFTRRLSGADVTIAHSDHDITYNIGRVCHEVISGANVEMRGDGTRYTSQRITEGTLATASHHNLFIEGTVSAGYSGGPVVDMDQACIIGSIIGTLDEFTVAANLVELLEENGY